MTRPYQPANPGARIEVRAVLRRRWGGDSTYDLLARRPALVLVSLCVENICRDGAARIKGAWGVGNTEAQQTPVEKQVDEGLAGARCIVRARRCKRTHWRCTSTHRQCGAVSGWEPDMWPTADPGSGTDTEEPRPTDDGAAGASDHRPAERRHRSAVTADQRQSRLPGHGPGDADTRQPERVHR